MADLQPKERLGRSLGFFPTFAIGTGTMIGAGIFVLPGIATSSAGPAAIISFIFGGIISMATAMSMAELATGMPRAGGSYYFISRAMGAVFGSIIGLGAWLALVFKGSFALVGLGDYLFVFLPIPVLITAFVAGIILLFINYRGAKSSGSFQNIIVIILFVILILFILKGALMLDTAKFDPFMPYGYSSILATTGLIFISYLGITQLAAISEEVKDPSKNLPRAFIASVASVTLLYTGVMIVINGMLPLEKAIVTSTPLVDVADIMAGSSGQIIIVFAGLLATISTANAAILASSRFPFAMGRDDLMPKWFVEIHSKYDTPYKAILVTGIVMLLLLLLFNVEQLAKLGSTFNILIFVLINLSAVILRRSSMEWYKPTFKDPFYPLTQIIGIVGSLMLLPLIGLMPLAFAIVVVAAGIAWYIIYGKDKAIPKYNVLDLIENTVVPVETTYEKIKVLVPLANPEHEKDLLKLADKLGDEIVGLHVIRVPGQTSLLAAQEAYHENKLQINNELEKKFRECIRLPERKHEYIVAFDHSVSNSIMEQSGIEKVTLIVMGWHEVDRFHPSVGNVANKVLASAKNHIIILKGYMPPEIKTILVAFNGKDNSKYCLYLAKRLAMTTGAQIKLLRVINPDISAEEKQEKINETKEAALAEEGFNIVYEIQEKYSTEDAILEAANEHDIMMIGDSSQRFKRAFLGTLPQRIARHTRKPVIIVKRYKPLSKEGISSIFVKINTVKNRSLRKLKLKK